jgi:hypothetical protein
VGGVPQLQVVPTVQLLLTVPAFMIAALSAVPGLLVFRSRSRSADKVDQLPVEPPELPEAPPDELPEEVPDELPAELWDVVPPLLPELELAPELEAELPPDVELELATLPVVPVLAVELRVVVVVPDEPPVEPAPVELTDLEATVV